MLSKTEIKKGSFGFWGIYCKHFIKRFEYRFLKTLSFSCQLIDNNCRYLSIYVKKLLNSILNVENNFLIEFL